MDIPRWTFDELYTRYELEPDLNDVFTEGMFDVEIIRRSYNYSNTKSRTVYSVDSVDIPAELFVKNYLTEGNKQKLVVLSRELSTVNQQGCVKFIVDRDTDHWFGDLDTSNNLIWTEFCDMESYFFEELLVRELIVDAGRAKISDWPCFYASFVASLKELYCIRVAARSLNIPTRILEFKKLLSKSDGVIYFNRSEFIRRTLIASGYGSRLDEFFDEFLKWNSKINGDPRLFCRGHDFICLLSWCILKFNGSSALSDESIERILVLLVPRFVDRFLHLL